MRLESTAKPDEYKVWMTDDEIDALRRAAANHRDDLIILLGSYVGLRAFEIPQVQPAHVRRTEDGDHYRLRVPEGKDTSGNGGSPGTPTSRATWRAPSTDTGTPRTSTPTTRSSTSPSGASAPP